MLRIAFIVAAVGWTVLSVVLSLRQIGHVRAHRAAVPADFAATITLADHQKAADYTIARERLGLVETAIGLVVALGWACGGIALLDRALDALMPPSILRGVVFLVGTGVVSALIGLPVDVVRAFGLEARFGFNRTSPGLFVRDKLKGWALALALAVPLIAVALWIMRVASGLWWLWAWAGLMAITMVAPAVYVRLIAPRFNRFTPLGEGELRRRIEALLTEAGFRSSGLFTMDASRRTAHGNAYFIGFGRAKRIVLFDTLVDASPLPEVEAVIAHELGHFRHHHILFALARSAVVTLVGLAAFGWLCRQPWLLPSFGLQPADDAVRLFVCLLLASTVGPLLAPLSNWISRRNEFQADDYARRAVGADPMVKALTRLARDNASTLTPDPLYALAHYSHPPVPIRIRHLREGDVAGAAVAR